MIVLRGTACLDFAPMRIIFRSNGFVCPLISGIENRRSLLQERDRSRRELVELDRLDHSGNAAD